MTPLDLAWIILVWFPVGDVWSLIDPRAAKLDIKPARLIAACLIQVAVIWLCFTVVVATPAFIVAYALGLVILSLLRLAVHGEDA